MISLALLFEQLKAGGWRWVYKRACREWYMPTTATGRALYRARTLSYRRPLVLNSSRADTLYAFYDLAVAPLTFDVLWFLVGADLVRRQNNLKYVHVVIVPGPVDGLRDERPDYEAVVGRDDRRARIANILVPATHCLRCLEGVTIAKDRDEAEWLAIGGQHVFPNEYEPAMPRAVNPLPLLIASRREKTEIAVLHATQEGLIKADAWLTANGIDRRPIVITLRGYGYMPVRNSNLPAWIAFARSLDRTRFSPIFIPDTHQPATDLAALAEFSVCLEAAQDVGLRMAFYERAYLNMGVNSGPMGLCWLNPLSRDLTFKIVTSAPQTTEASMRHYGFEIGKSLPFATPNQRWVWNDDDLPVIRREFEMMVAQIEHGGASGKTKL